MTTHPILFSGPMVRAIMDGRKTQTRRVIKPQPDGLGKGTLLSVRSADGSIEHIPFGGFAAHPDALCFRYGSTFKAVYCPYGQSGDLLWVRETWAVRNAGRAVKATEQYAGRVICAADHQKEEHVPGLVCQQWRPSIHMPRWASRLTLRITDVRVERVQEISTEDTRAEGIDDCEYSGGGAYCTHCGGHEHLCDRDRFKDLWDFINVKRGYSWDSNPWVWVVEFEANHTNVDHVVRGEKPDERA